MTDVVALARDRRRAGRGGRGPMRSSAPVALDAARPGAKAHPGLTVRVLLDERSAGYFALGSLARRAGRSP
jgi:2-succinyl-5-enolpyruvyl-6-hydroxy-3-cyclohexene-1-carboxylate synthase